MLGVHTLFTQTVRPYDIQQQDTICNLVYYYHAAMEIPKKKVNALVNRKLFVSWTLHKDNQAPLSDTTKARTALITFSGVYEFTRLPFAPKRAPSYFSCPL